VTQIYYPACPISKYTILLYTTKRFLAHSFSLQKLTHPRWRRRLLAQKMCQGYSRTIRSEQALSFSTLPAGASRYCCNRRMFAYLLLLRLVPLVSMTDDDGGTIGLCVHAPCCRRRCRHWIFAIVPAGPNVVTDVNTTSSSSSTTTDTQEDSLL
jgi:hypothetical protein